ncbi:plasmid mobilization relaxosome protein MobC [Streptomyces sp. NPDC048637]|uniref:plasmid mobilization protein n=1 Tax=Streptomyces sp. NPDC048637 TaxID=3155636 RepID=UPI003421525D
MAEAVQRQGAPDRGDATEGGRHPQEEKTTHPCHNPHCTQHASAPSSQPPARNRTPKTKISKRKHLIASRFNDDEKQSVLDAATACAMTPSGFLAHAALSAARDLTRTAAEIAGEREMLAELFSLRRHLGQVGNNLNQVAKTFNSGGDAPQVEAVLSAVHRAARRVDDFTQYYLDSERPAA